MRFLFICTFAFATFLSCAHLFPNPPAATGGSIFVDLLYFIGHISTFQKIFNADI